MFARAEHGEMQRREKLVMLTLFVVCAGALLMLTSSSRSILGMSQPVGEKHESSADMQRRGTGTRLLSIEESTTAPSSDEQEDGVSEEDGSLGKLLQFENDIREARRNNTELARQLLELQQQLEAKNAALKQQQEEKEDALKALKVAAAEAEAVALQQAKTARPTAEAVKVEDAKATLAAVGNKFELTEQARYVPSSMREVIDWEIFDAKTIYSWHRYWNVMKPLGATKIELEQVVAEATAISQSKFGKTYIFSHGFLRVDPFRGTEYIVDFVDARKDIKRIGLFRAFAPAFLPSTDFVAPEASSRTLYAIMPLSGRLDMMKMFMSSFATAALGPNRPPIYLIIVYMIAEGAGPEEQAEFTAIKDLLVQYGESHELEYKLIVLNRTFVRGIGIETGVMAIPEAEASMFFVDVDMKFDAAFLTRCRANMYPGKQAFFPIVFSLYSGKPQTVGQDNGAWRNYGLGMVCVYKSDFIANGGYDKNIKGWGREDVDFYERMIKAQRIEVFRSTDPGILHVYHGKVCDSKLSEDQFSDCMGSKADWEGTKKDLGKQLAKYELRVQELSRLAGIQSTTSADQQQQQQQQQQLQRREASENSVEIKPLDGSKTTAIPAALKVPA